MDERLALEPAGDAEVAQELDGVVLEQARAHALLDVGAIVRLEDHRVDAAPLEQQGERESGGAGAHDADLCPHADARYTRRGRWRTT